MPFVGTARCRTWRRIVKQARSRPRSSSPDLLHQTNMLRARLGLSLSRPQGVAAVRPLPAELEPFRLLAADHADAIGLLGFDDSTSGQLAHRLFENPTSPPPDAPSVFQSCDAG